MKNTALLIILMLVVVSCKAKSGPEDIVLDRDTCDSCHMTISDPTTVAEIRGGSDHLIRRFDDFGCAMNYAVEHDLLGDVSTEIWAADSSHAGVPAKWLDARHAFYRANSHTPMDYGYTAVPLFSEGVLTFEHVIEHLAHRKPLPSLEKQP